MPPSEAMKQREVRPVQPHFLVQQQIPQPGSHPWAHQMLLLIYVFTPVQYRLLPQMENN